MTRSDYCPVSQEPCQAMCVLSDVRCQIRDGKPMRPAGDADKAIYRAIAENYTTQTGAGCVLSNDDMHSAEEIAHLKDLLGKANALARLRAERIKELEAQPGAEPAPSAVVCGRCDGTGLDARYCNYQCEKCDGSGQAGAEPVAWTHDCAVLLTNNIELWIGACPHCGKPRTSSSQPAKPARVPLTEGELLSMWSGGDERFMRPVLGKNKILAFALAVIAAYEAKNGIKE